MPMAKVPMTKRGPPASPGWRRAKNTYSIAALMAAAAVIPLLPAVPHQHLIHLAGPLRLNVLLAFGVVTLLLLGVVFRRAGPWWASGGIVAAPPPDPTPAAGGAVGALAILPMVAFSALIIAAGIATLRGTVTSAYGVVIALSSAVASVIILRAGSDPDISLVVTVLLVVTTGFLMTVIRTRQRPPAGSMLELTAARQAYGSAQISACNDAGAKLAVALPSGSYAPLRTALSVAVVGGDPICAPGEMKTAIAELFEVCRGHGMIPCVFQARADLARDYRKAGYHLLKFGEEAIVDLPEWDLSTPRLANVRRELARAKRAGLTFQTRRADDLDEATWSELERVSERWRGRRFELGFSMRRVTELLQSDAIVNTVADANGTIVAFSSWHGLADGVALDVLRRDPQAPPGAMDLCIAQMLIDARGRGLKWASLGSVPFRDEAGDVAARKLATMCRRALYSRGMSGYRYRSLARFKAKFGCRWESRMIAVGGGLSGIPLAALAIVVAHRRTQPTHVRKLRLRRPARRGGNRVPAPAPRRRWLLSAAVAALITASVVAAVQTPVSDWLFSEGAGTEVSLLLATLAAAGPAAVLSAALGVGGWATFTGAMAVFAGTYLVPFVPRAVGASVAPEVTTHSTALGWAEVFAAALVLAAGAVGAGILIGQAIHRGTGPLLGRVRRSRRVAAAVALAAVLAALGGSQIATLLSAGPVSMVYSYASNSAIPKGDVVGLTVDGRKALIYKPALLRTYPNASLPVIYFLHGQPGSETDWLGRGAALPSILDQLIANKTIPPLVAVMPDGSTDHYSAGVWSNTAVGQTSETWILDRLIPAVQRQVHVLGRECTSVAGYSEGGFSAVNIALRHPDVFGAAASYSGYFDADPGVFGPASAANSPTVLARQIAPQDRMPIFLGAGTTDRYGVPTVAFGQELGRLNWRPYTVTIVRGSHSMATWRLLIVDSLTWTAQTWKTSQTQNGAASICSPQF
jgi:lysylphosphatidylglycerol synthetase-like protein (DUF2156 family)/enterochelin esterase-like enzyme